MPLFSAISKFERAYKALMQSIETLLFIEGEVCIFLFFHRQFHRAVEMVTSVTPALLPKT
jgi:hypothetical protein